MFATILRRVARKIQVRSSKVKVTLRGQRSEKGSNFRVRSVTLSFFGGFRNYLAEMFATILQRVARKIQVRSSKVKVTLRGQRSEKGSNFRVRSVTLSFFGGFRNYLAEMFATILRRVARKIQVRSSKVKVTLRGQRSEKGSNFRVRSVTLSFFGGFRNYLAEMFATILRRVARKIQVRSSKVKVTLRGQRSEKGSNFRVRSVTLSFFGGFRNYLAEMFATILRRVARKIQVRSSKVKVTLRGQRSEKGSNFRVRSVTLSFFDGFRNYLAEMFATILRRVARKIQVRSSKVKVTLRGQRSEKGSNFRVRSVTLSFFGGFRNYLAEMFATILRRVARKIQVRSSKVKVTLRGQRSEKGSNFRVRSVTLSFFGGFRNYLAEMFATILRRVARKIQVRSPRSRSHKVRKGV